MLFAQYILFIHQDNLRLFNPKDPTSLCWAADILFILLLICPKVIKLFNKIKIKIISCEDYEDKHKNFFAKSFIIAFIYFLIYYVVYYPGCFSP
ncbi:MAG: hypothetical protein IJR21_01580, partial [Synergistaceae bacterium]|nr:hypothetical protein [Synergistaceae bacterium]